MQKEIIVNGNTLEIKEYKGQRVVTFEDVDRVHQRAKGTAKRNFNQNKNFFIENEDYYFVTVANSEKYEIRTFEIPARGIVLLTETGYLMLVKSLTDKLAWDVQRKLVKSYFNQKGQLIQPTLLDVKQEEPLKKLYYNGKRVMTANQIAQVTSRSVATIFNIIHKHDIKYEQLEGKEVRIFRKDNDLYPNLAFIYVFPYKSVSDIFRILGLNTKILNTYFGTLEIEGKKKHEVYDNLISVFFNMVDTMEMKDILNQELIYLKENNDSEQMVSMMMDFFKMLKIRVAKQTK